jgi:hypothetical protein
MEHLESGKICAFWKERILRIFANTGYVSTEYKILYIILNVTGILHLQKSKSSFFCKRSSSPTHRPARRTRNFAPREHGVGPTRNCSHSTSPLFPWHMLRPGAWSRLFFDVL